jgi:hypothetical protein
MLVGELTNIFGFVYMIAQETRRAGPSPAPAEDLDSYGL